MNKYLYNNINNNIDPDKVVDNEHNFKKGTIKNALLRVKEKLKLTEIEIELLEKNIWKSKEKLLL